MMRLLSVAALLLSLLAEAHAAAVACTRTRLHAVSGSEWRVACEDSNAFAAFEPSAIQRFLLDHDAAVRVASPEVFLSSTFDRVAALESTTLTQFTLKAEPLWVHTTPVTIDSAAFAKLSSLQTLILQDVPLANTQLHLLLPATIQKVVIVGCHLQRFSYEIVGGGEPKALLAVDLHANDLVEIPVVLFALPSTVINLDVRLNKLSTISVSASNKQTLEQWMKKGVLQIDNIKNSCPSTATTARVEGLSQVFDVCVTPSDRATVEKITGTDSAKLASGNTSSVDQDADANDFMGPPPATVHSPNNEAATISTPPASKVVSQPKDAVSKTADERAKLPTVYAALVALGVVSAMLFSFAFAMAVARRRQDKEPKDSLSSFTGRGKSRSSLLTQVTTDECGGLRRSSDASNASQETGMVTPTLPEFVRPNRAGRSISEASAVATPINGCGGRALYTTIATPHSKSQPYMMSRSLQSLTGVSQFSVTSMEKESELRVTNKEKLRKILTELTRKRGILQVNQTPFVCFDEVKETEVGALMVRCSTASPANSEPSQDAQPPPSLLLKIYVEQDVRVAIREYRALLVMQSNTCRQFVSQMVATEMEKTLEGLKCAVIVVEMGSATTFRHIVRGQINRSKQFEVVQQLYAVVKALDCLHERQFIHGGVHLDALVVHPSEANRLKFRDLEHATRFGDTIQSSTTLLPYGSLEYTPPEMARHLLCCAQESQLPGVDTVEADAYQVIRASCAYDTWCLGILILKIYANSKHLDEFDGCETPKNFFLKLAEDEFSFERSLTLYIHHDDVRDLARACLRRDPRKRPKLASILSHRVFRAYDRLEQGDLVASFRADRLKAANKTREVSPPTIWFFLPPRALGLAKTRTIDDWISELTAFQQHQRHDNRFRSAELMFPLVFLCEDSHYVSTPCSSTGFHHSRFHLPASLLSLAMPLVQESTLFLEAKSILSAEPQLNIADVSGLGVHQWNELMKFYRALEKMMLAPISSFSLLLLKPLEEMLADQDEQQARQVLDELKSMIFSREKRDHVLSLLDILKTLSINAELDGSYDGDEDTQQEDQHEDGDEGSVVSVDDDDGGLATRRATKEWSRLRKCELEGDASVSMPSTRWLCRRHWECEMECEV